MNINVHTEHAGTLVAEGRWVCGDGPGPELREHIRALIERGQVEVTLDLAAVTAVDSTGVGAIASAHIALHKRGGRLMLQDPQPRVAQLLQVAGLTTVIEVRTTGRLTAERAVTDGALHAAASSGGAPTWAATT